MKKMLLLNSLIFGFLLATSSIFAQQWEIMPKLVVGTDTVTSVFEIDNYGSDMYFSTNKGLFFSSDNGDSWSNLTWTNGIAANQAITNAFVDLSNDYMYVSSDSSVYKSTDNGASWVTTAINENLKFINDIAKPGNNLLIAYGNYLGGGIYYSSDDLASVQAASMINVEIRDILALSGTDFAGGKDGAYKSTDNGQTWVLAGTGHPVNGKYGKLIKEGNRLLAADIFGKGLYKSDDNGDTWSNADSIAYTGFCQVFDIAAANGTIITTVDGVCNGSEPIKSSTDNGDSWSAFIDNLPVNYYPTLGANTATGCFFAFNATLKQPFRYCSPASVSDYANSENTIEIYPNPAKDVIQIKSAFEFQSFTITDMTGKIILSKNGFSNSIDISELKAGVYFLRLNGDKGLTRKKFIKH